MFKTKPILLRLALLLLAGVLAAVLLMSAAYAIPNEALEDNVARSRYYINSVEGIAYTTYFHSNSQPLRVGNYTNHIMLHAALSDPALSPLQNAMSVNDYARYWHGYMIFLRPMLCVGTIELIRYVNMALLLLLFTTTCSLLVRKLGFAVSVPFVLSLAMVWFLFVPMSLTYVSVFYIMLLAVCVLLTRFERMRDTDLCVFFFAIGMLTSFFDLLTAPLLTLGMPLLVLLALKLSAPLPARRPLVLDALMLSVFWGLGFGLFWLLKWLIAAPILGQNVLGDAANSILFRLNGVEAGADAVPWNRLTVILDNVKMLIPSYPSSFLTIFAVFFGLLCAYAAALFLTGAAKKLPKIKSRDWLAFPMISAYPYVWYCVLVNHSGIHARFTCKIQAIAIFASFLAVLFALAGRGPKKGAAKADLASASPLQTEK